MTLMISQTMLCCNVGTDTEAKTNNHTRTTIEYYKGCLNTNQNIRII